MLLDLVLPKKSSVNSLEAAGRNASDALALIGTIDGALEESGEILQRMRELAVQSASDTNTGTDRTFIQDEINQLAQEINRISSSTEFNSVKLLDGTYTDKSIQIGTGANQVFRLGVSATDANTRCLSKNLWIQLLKILMICNSMQQFCRRRLYS